MSHVDGPAGRHPVEDHADERHRGEGRDEAAGVDDPGGAADPRGRVERPGHVEADHRARAAHRDDDHEDHEQPERCPPGPEQHRRPRGDRRADDPEHERAPREGVAPCPASRRPGSSAIVVTVIVMSRMLAVRGVRPCPETRNGKPHSIVNMLAANCDVKWVHRPSRVPGPARPASGCAPERPEPQVVAVVVGVRAVLDDEDEQDAGDDPEGGGHGIRRRPAERRQRSGQRAGRRERTQLTRADPSAGSPSGSVAARTRAPPAEHRDEHHRVAHAEQHAAHQAAG